MNSSTEIRKCKNRSISAAPSNEAKEDDDDGGLD